MRLLVVDESRTRARVLRAALEEAGHEVVVSLGAPLALLAQVERAQPDVIIIHTESPTRDVIEHLVVMREQAPRPIVMFARDSARETIRSVVSAGVSAYVVDGLDPARVGAIVDVACARFDDYQRLRAELADANLKLSERKVVERAKGILMKRRGVDESEAFAALRRLAMDRNRRLAEVARQVIDADDLLA
jgi:response regulator NasT